MCHVCVGSSLGVCKYQGGFAVGRVVSRSLETHFSMCHVLKYIFNVSHLKKMVNLGQGFSGSHSEV